MVTSTISFVCQRNLFSCFFTIEFHFVCSVMVCIIFHRVNSDRIICISCVVTTSSCTTVVNCYCFTSCIFNSITGNINFVLSIWVARVFTITYRDVSNVSVTSCISFFNYTFSRGSTSRYRRSISYSYFINCFIRISCIFSYCYILRTRSYFKGMVQFSFCVIGQISYYICTRSSCFDVLTVVSTYNTEA